MSRTIVVDSTTVKVLMSCKGKDQYRRNLHGIHITDKYLETTDGHKLVRVPYPKQVLDQFTATLSGNVSELRTDDRVFGKTIEIDKLTLKAKQQLVFGDANEQGVSIHIVENLVVVHSFFARFVDADFPQTDQVITDLDDEESIIIGIGIPLLKDIVNAYTGADAKGALEFTISTKDPERIPFLIKGNKNGNEYNYVAMPMRL